MDYDDFTGGWVQLYVGLVRKVITWRYFEIGVGVFLALGVLLS